MKISYGITVHNEADELNRLLEILIHKTQSQDEIIICVDGKDDAVEHVLQSWTQQYADLKTMKIYQAFFFWDHQLAMDCDLRL